MLSYVDNGRFVTYALHVSRAPPSSADTHSHSHESLYEWVVHKRFSEIFAFHKMVVKEAAATVPATDGTGTGTQSGTGASEGGGDIKSLDFPSKQVRVTYITVITVLVVIVVVVN